MVKPVLLALLVSLAPLVPRAAHADPKPGACPATVTSAIARAFPKSVVRTCKPEGKQFEVKLTRADGAEVEVDVAADGKLLQIEEKIALDKVPAAVLKAFAAKYPKAKLEAAEKQTPTTGAPRYELAFTGDRGRHEATFGEDGAFVEEE